jgi:hypothetical protein
MILGLSFETFVLLHVLISIVAIVTGLIALVAMIRGAAPDWVTHVFLWTTALTTLTGFLFPLSVITPAVATGIVSTVILVAAFAAIYAFNLAGPWRWIFATTAIAALYLNCFVFVVQSFQKISELAALAPTQSEAPFLIAQTALLAAFVWAGWRAIKGFHPPALAAAA